MSEVTEDKKKTTIELKIVYSHNEKLEVSETETIEQVKLAALDLFKIGREEAGSFVLKAKVEGEKDTQLDEAKTVADYGLKDEEKVILTAGSPFGAGRA